MASTEAVSAVREIAWYSGTDEFSVGELRYRFCPSPHRFNDYLQIRYPSGSLEPCREQWDSLKRKFKYLVDTQWLFKEQLISKHNTRKEVVAVADVSVYDRLVDYLDVRSSTQGLRFSIKQTHVAEELGCAPSAVNTALRRLQSEGLLKFKGSISGTLIEIEEL